MQKKFWSALLSMAMIISCFSGVASAALTSKNYGAPSYDLNSPTNTNITMSTTSFTEVVVAPRTAYTLSGRLAVQGSESINSNQYMTSERVADLYEKLTGVRPASNDTDSHTLIMGLVNDPTDNTNTVAASTYATQRWYLDRAKSDPNSLSTTKSAILATKFYGSTNTNINNFLKVETDGRFTDSFVPEFHTTRFYGFGIKSLGQQDKNGYWVFPYETTDVEGGASQTQVDAAKDAYLDAANDVKDYQDPTKGAYVTLNVYATLGYGSADVAYTELENVITVLQKAYDTNKTMASEGQAVVDKAWAKEDETYEAWKAADKLEKALDTVYQAQIVALTAMGAQGFEPAYTIFMETDTTDVATYGTRALAVAAAALAVINEAYEPADVATYASRIERAQTDIEAATDVTYEAYKTAVATIHSNVNLALTTQSTAANNAGSAWSDAKGDLGEKLEAYNQAKAARIKAEADLNTVNDPGFTTLQNNIESAIVAAGKVFNTFETELAKLVKVANDAYSAWQIAENSTSDTNKPIKSTVANRILQAKPLEVRFQYKLRDAAQTFISGTSTSQTVSGYIVDANGNAPEHDFEYEIHTTDVPTGNSTLVTRGRTSGGYFIFTIPNVDGTIEYYLCPTQRYDSKLNDMVTISPYVQETRYVYLVANGTRQAYYKAEMETTSAVSGVTYQPIVVSKLYTYDESDTYNALGVSRTGNAYLYGVSYAIRNADTGKFLVKDYRIYDSTVNSADSTTILQQNVRFAYDNVGYYTWIDQPWNDSAKRTYVFDATGVGSNTPILKTNDAGELVFDGQKVEICFIGTGTASLRLRSTGRVEGQVSPKDNYQSILTINVESPGIVAHTGGTEMKKINFDSKDPFAIELISTSDTPITELRLNKIRFEGMEDDDQELIKGDKNDAELDTLSYKIDGKNITIYVPWDMVTVGGRDLELDIDFLTDKNTIVTTKTIVVKNSLWNVSTSVATLTVSSNNSFIATVTDRDGLEQNRAALEVHDEFGSIGSNRSYNVVGGRYTFENINPGRGGSIYIIVRESRDATDVKTMIEIQAVGKADYTATMVSGYENAVTGISSSIRFDVVNSSGAAATDLTSATVYTLAGKKSGNIVDNGDQLKLSHQGNGNYRIPIIGLKPGSYILRVSTNNMTHYVDIPFEVLQLQIEFTNNFEALTWDYSYGKNSDFRNANQMNFTVKNPITGAVIPTAIDDSKLELLDEDGEKSDLVLNLATTTSPHPDGNITLTDKDYSRYLVSNNYDTHDFYVGLVDTRSASTRNAEGDLGLRFYLKVRDGGSTGTQRSVEGFTVPVTMPTITASPSSVARGTTTAVDLYVKDANGNPVIGVQVRTDGEDMAQRTDGDGKTTYLFTPLTTGSSKRFDITGFAVDQTVTYYDSSNGNSTATVKSAPVYTTVNIINDVAAPTITLDPYVSETTKSSVTISGKLFDEGGLSEIVVGNSGRRYSGQTEATFSYSIPLELGNNAIVIMAFDSSNNASEITVNVMRKEASVMVLTVGSTETVGVSGLDVAPVVRNGVTFLPIRFVFENMLKGKVDYDANSKTITSSFMGHTLVLTIGSTTAILDGQNITLSSAPEIDPATNRTLAPIRTILQAVGITVDYNAANGAITITGAGDQDVITYPSNTAAPTTTTTPAAEVEVEEEVVEEEVVEEEVVEEEVEEEVTE